MTFATLTGIIDREMAKDFNRSEIEAERLATIALGLPRGSDEWKAASRTLADFLNKCAARGIELTK